MNNDELEQIYINQSSKMLSFIRKTMSKSLDIHDERDILHDAFFALLEGMDVAKPIDNLTAYLFHAIRNKIIDLFRKKRPFESLEDEAFPREDEAFERLEREEAMAQLERALAQLPPEQRDIFIKTEIKELSFKQISLESGVPLNTLLSQKRYAVQKLKKILTES